MKHLILSFGILIISLSTALGQYAEPAVTGANYVPGQIEQGQVSVLTVSFANSGSSAIPASSIQLTISTAKNYYKSDGVTVPGGAGGALFSWAYLGSDVWRGTNTNPIPAFSGGEIKLTVTGVAVSPSYETTNINVQPVANFSAFTDSPNNNNLQPKLKITESQGKVALSPKVYLQGALFGVFLPDTLMRDELRIKDLIPTISPYPGLGLNGITLANTTQLGIVNSSTPSTNNSIVDWVYVELRSAADSSLLVDSRSALLQRDGDIVDVDGVSPLTFTTAIPGSYHVAVRHRNHLGVMSRQPIPLSSVAKVVDFRKGGIPSSNLNPANPVNVSQIAVEQGVALWAGNALYENTLNNKREVIFQGSDNDVNVIYQLVINATANQFFKSPAFKLKGYYNGDVNMDGETVFQGTGNDVEYIYQNVLKNHAGNAMNQPFFIIREQTP
jgi:hypothetical protein